MPCVTPCALRRRACRRRRTAQRRPGRSAPTARAAVTPSPRRGSYTASPRPYGAPTRRADALCAPYRCPQARTAASARRRCQRYPGSGTRRAAEVPPHGAAAAPAVRRHDHALLRPGGLGSARRLWLASQSRSSMRPAVGRWRPATRAEAALASAAHGRDRTTGRHTPRLDGKAARHRAVGATVACTAGRCRRPVGARWEQPISAAAAPPHAREAPSPQSSRGGAGSTRARPPHHQAPARQGWPSTAPGRPAARLHKWRRADGDTCPARAWPRAARCKPSGP